MDVDDSDSEYEVEESVVLVELNGIIDANFLLQEQTPTKILGIDTEKPILQIGHYIFSGEYEHTMGTVVAYQPTDSTKNTSGNDYEYVCKTDKKLTMKRIFIKEKTNDNANISEGISCSVPIPNGESNKPSVIFNELGNTENNHFGGIHPNEAHRKTVNIENDTRSLSLNSKESKQKTSQSSSSIEICKSHPAHESSPNVNDSENVTPENTFAPEKSLNSKNKDRKRKKEATEDDQNKKGAESTHEDIEPVPCSKHRKTDESGIEEKVQEKEVPEIQFEKEESEVLEKDRSSEIQGKDEYEVQEKEESEIQGKVDLEVQDKDESEIQRKDQSEIQGTEESEVEEKDESEIQGKIESKVHGKDESEVQGKDEAEGQGKDESKVQDRDESEVQGKDESEVQEKEKSQLQAKNEIEMQEKDKCVVQKSFVPDAQGNVSGVQSKDVSGVHDKNVSDLQGKDISEVWEKNEPDIRRQDESDLQQKDKSDKAENVESDKLEKVEFDGQKKVESDLSEKAEFDRQRNVETDIQETDEPISFMKDESSVSKLQNKEDDSSKNEPSAQGAIECSLNDTLSQENLLVSSERTSQSNENSLRTEQSIIGINSPHHSADNTNDVLPEKKLVIDNDDNVPEIERIGINIEVSSFNPEENEASLISNSETANQLVESSTDKMLLSDNSTNVNEVKNGNCSSSGDMIATATNNNSVHSDTCQSSDSKKLSNLLQESIEEFSDVFGASSSTNKKSKKSRHGQGDGSVSKSSPFSKSVQADLLKPASCEVSQSLDGNAGTEQLYSEVKDSNECQTSVPLRRQSSSERDIDNADEVDVRSDEFQLFAEGVEPTKRKLSSCEVTQSSNSEREFSETSEEVSECEVFSQNRLPGIDGMFNRSANEALNPFGLAAGSSDEVGASRSSLTSESSTSEVSQSHKSVIQDSKSVEVRNLEDLPFTDAAECSQSSDQVNDSFNYNSTESNNKDLCVSSCDVNKGLTSHTESLEPEKNIRNVGCEVSQSDKLGASTSSHNMENEELLSNECDAPSMVLEENQSHNINQYGSGSSHTSSEATDTETISGRQMTCEVSQSFSSIHKPSVSGINLKTDNKFSSNECDNYANSCPSGVSSDDSNNCVSSDDVSHFSLPLNNEKDEQQKDPMCEVSQSFRSGQDVVSPDDPCGSSDRDQRNLSADKLTSKNSCEVSQSLELESSSVSELYEDEDDSINECERSNLNLDAVDQSDDNVEEICESSDDIIVPSNDESNSQSEQMSSINNSGCEVSQSYRLEDGVLLALSEQFFVGVESSNECERYGSSVSSAPEYNISRSDSEEKNVCESSDDIERSSGEVKSSSQNSKSDSQEACQSTKSDDNFACDTARVSENDSNEYDDGNEACNFTDDGVNVCESSVDININDDSPVLNSDACSSSDKPFKKPDDKIKQCDSFTNQAVAGPSTEVSIGVMEGNHISQSENESTTELVSSNSSQSNTVKVSSSVDSISSNYVDVIYSSSNVSNSTTSSNSEVSQSSARKGPYVWSGNLLSAASSSNSSIGSALDNVSSDGHFESSFSSDVNVQSSANSNIVVTESQDSVGPGDSSMTSSQSNDVIESSISSSLASGNRIKKHILKKTNELSGENLNSSLPTSVTKEQKRESVILGGNCSNKPDFSNNSSFQNQLEVDSMSQQFPQQHSNVSEFEGSLNPNTRPSLLEVMVSSASDFRNSLLYESGSFSKETNNSSVVESSSNNVRSSNEFPETFISDLTRGTSEASGVDTPAATVPKNFMVENSDSSITEVIRSFEGRGNKSSSKSIKTQHQVSQSSDIINTHSSSNQTQAQESDDISESLRSDFVQSSSQELKALHIPTGDTSNTTTSFETNTFLASNSSKKAEVPESSSTHFSVPTYSGNTTVSSENSAQSIESSSDLQSSFNRSGNIDSEVSSMPSIIDRSNLDIPIMDSSEQCSVIEGNLVILSRSGTIFNRSEDDLTQVEVLSAQSGFVPFQPGDQVLIQTSNEADILNNESVFSPSTAQLPLHEMPSSIASTSQTNAYEFGIEGNLPTPPADEVHAIVTPQEGDRSSEVSESHSTGLKIQSQSILADNNVSCSVNEFSLTNETNDKQYTFCRGEFSGTSREAECKTSESISSFQNVCDDSILPVQNLPATDNADLSMYSHIGEFEDSIQSSSLDATRFSINEQIRAISSPPTFSNSDSSSEQIASNINTFVSFSTDSHNLSSVQYGIPSISNIPTSFIADDISSRLHTAEFLDNKSSASGITDTHPISRSSVVQSPNANYSQEYASIVGNEVSASESRGIVEDTEESSQMSGLVGTENSPEEYEVLSEYEEIENVEEDSNFVDSSND